MDLHALPRRDLQALAKRNGVRANMSNVAMADALAALPKVDGIEEYVKEPVAEPTAAAEPEVQAEEEEEEEEQAPAAEEQEQEATAPEKEEEDEREKQEPQEVIMLDDSEEEEKEVMPALGVARRRANRPARVEPVAAPATRKRAAACKAEKGDAALEAVPARTTRARSQRTVVSAGEEEASKARRTSRRAAASKTVMQQEEEEKETQGDVSDMEADVPAPVSSDEGSDRAEEMEAPMDAQHEEQNEPVEEQSKEEEGETEAGDAAAEAVPARATRARSKRTVEPVAEGDAPKTRRTRRAAARKTSTEQEEEEKGTQGDVSDVEAAVPALISSEEGGDGAEKMDAQNEEQNGPVEEQSQETEGEPEKGDEAPEAVPARATRARRQRTVVSAAEEEAPKVRRTSRRAVARKTSTEQEEEEKAAEGDVSEMEAVVPAPVSSDEGGDGAEEMEAAMDAQNEEQLVTAEAEKGDAAEEVVPARPTRSRRQRTVVPAAEQEAPKARRASRRAVARNTNTEQEKEEERAQGEVFDVEAAVPAPSSDEGGDGAEDMEAAIDAQNEEQNELAAEQSPEDEGVVVDIPAPVEEEPPVVEDCMVDSSVEEQLVDVQQCEGSPVVLGLSEQEGGDGFQNDAVSSDQASEDTETVADDEVLQTPLKSGEATEEVDFTSSVGHAGEEKEVPTSEVVLQSAVKAIEQEDMQTPLKSGEATEEVNFTSSVGHASEEKESEEVLQSAVKAIDEQEEMAADGVINYTDVSVEDMAGHTSEENGDCMAEDEPPMPEDVDSSVQEQLVHVQQCEETDLASEDTEMVPISEVPQAMLESGEAMVEVDCTSDVDEQNEDCTVDEEPLVAEHVGSSLQEPLVDVQQCEVTVEENLAGEDTETAPVNVVPQTLISNTGHVSEANEHCTVEEELSVLADVDSPIQEQVVAVQLCEAREEIHIVVEVIGMVPVNEVPHAMLESGEATEEVDYNSKAGEENVSCTVEEEPPVADGVHSAIQEPLVDVQQCEATEEVDFTSDVGYANEEIEVPASDEMVQSAAKAIGESEVPSSDEVLHSVATAVEEDEDMAADEVATEEVVYTSDVGYANEEIEVPASDEMVQSAVKAIEESEVPSSDEVLHSVATAVEEDEDMAADEVATEEVVYTSDVYANEEIVVPASDEMVQSAVKAIEESEVPSSDELLQSAATLTDDADMAADEVHRSTDEHVEDEGVVATNEEIEEIEVPASDEMVQSAVKAIEESEVPSSDELLQSAATLTDDADMAADEVHRSTDEHVEDEGVVATNEEIEEIEVPASDEMVQSAVKAIEESEVPSSDEVLQSAATLTDDAVEEDEDMAADEVHRSTDEHVEDEDVVATNEMPQRSEATGKGVVEVVTVHNLSQATVTDDEGGFTADITGLSVEEEAAVTADEIPLSLGAKESSFNCDLADVSLEEKKVVAVMEENVEEVTMEESVQEVVCVEEKEVVAAMEESVEEVECDEEKEVVATVDDLPQVMLTDEIPHSSATMDEDVEEVVTVHNLFQATLTDDEWAVKESVFTGDCTPVVDTATDFSDHIASPLSANVFEDATKSLSVDSITVDNLFQATVTDDEWAVKDNSFTGDCTPVVDTATDFSDHIASPLSANVFEDASKSLSVDSITIDNLFQATVTDDEWAVKDNSFTGDCTPVVDTATDFSDHIASPLSANVFEDATKSLSVDSITVEPMVSEPADVPLPVQQEKEVKVGNEPGALGSFSTRKLSALGSRSTRKIGIKLKEKVAMALADGVPLCIFSSIGSEENSAEQVVEREKECNESEALGSLSLRKLRIELNEKVAVTQENDGEKSSVPLDKLSLRKLRIKLRETLNAQKNMEPKRVPLGRLDENAC